MQINNAMLPVAVRAQAMAKITYIPAKHDGPDDVGGPRWRIEGSPVVIVAAMKALSGTISRKRDAVSFPATQANFEDLQGIVARYPFDVDPQSERYWQAGLEELRALDNARAGLARDGSARTTAGLFKGELLPFQREGVDFIFGRRRCLLADDMGLGKTVQAFAALDEINEWPAVVVVQSHVMRHWERKIGEFMSMTRAAGGLRLGSTWASLQGSKANKFAPNADLYFVNYHCVHGWVSLLRARGVRTVFFDEVQEARRIGTRKADAIRSLAHHARNVVGLSGTPIYNRGIEIFNVMSAISRGCLGTKTEFISLWCGSDPEVVEDPQGLGSYLEDRGLMLRRRKEDVLTELPPKRRVIEAIDANNEQFAELIKEAAKLAQDAQHAADPLDRARMEAQAVQGARRATGIAKSAAVITFLRALLEAGEPTLLFCHHHAVHDAVLDTLQEFKPASISGRETTSGKELSQRRFENGETNLCVIGLRAATGLDGLQKRARVVVFAELDWSPAVHKQAEDRAHRYGQTDSVLSYYLVADIGTDPDMIASLNLKESQFMGIMRDEADTADDYEAAAQAARSHMQNVLQMLREIR